MIACAWTCSAQEHPAKVIEVLPDDQFIVEIAGRSYRAINADKVVEIAKGKLELVACKENEKRFTDLIEISRRDVTIATQRAEIERANFTRAMQLYETERALRVEAMTFLPRRQAGGLGGKVFNFIESPWGAILFKVGLQVPPFVKAMKQ